jgi:hypothetical protein
LSGNTPKVHGGFSNKKHISKYIQFVKLDLCSDHFSGWLCQSKAHNKDPIVGLDGARPPAKYPIAQSDNTFGKLAVFCKGIHPMYKGDLPTKSTFASI